MAKDTDMTVGNPFVLIGTFSFSLVTGNLFQQLYTFADTVIIGKKIGALGLAAVGGTEWLIFMVNGLVIGLVQGFSILLGHLSMIFDAKWQNFCVRKIPMPMLV